MRSVGLSCFPPHQLLALPAVLSCQDSTLPLMGLRDRLSCSGLHCWTNEWKKWDVDEVHGQRNEMLVKIMRVFFFQQWSIYKQMYSMKLLHYSLNLCCPHYSLAGQSQCHNSVFLQCSISLTSVVLIKYPTLFQIQPL